MLRELNVAEQRSRAALPFMYIDPAGGTVIAGAGDDRPARARRRGELRASDADRERVIDTLKAAYVYGLVTKDELGERVSQALASRTCAELELVTADIPAGLAAAPATLSPPLAKARPAAHGNPRPGERAVVAAAVLAVLALTAAFVFRAQAGGLLALGAVGSSFAGMFLAAVQILKSRRDKGSGGQLPPRGAISAGQSSGQLPRASQPQRHSPAGTIMSSSPRTLPST